MKRLRLNVGCIVCFDRKTEFLRSDWKCKAFHEWQLLGSLHQVLSVYEKGITSVAGAVWFSCSHKRNLETNCLKLLMTKIKSRSLIFLATLSIPRLSQRGVTPTEAWTFRAKQKWTLQTYVFLKKCCTRKWTKKSNPLQAAAVWHAWGKHCLSTGWQF